MGYGRRGSSPTYSRTIDGFKGMMPILRKAGAMEVSQKAVA
jgi:hypothetical protein